MSRKEMPVIVYGGSVDDRSTYIQDTYPREKYTVTAVEYKGSSVGIEDIRVFLSLLQMQTVTERDRVFVFEQAERITQQAQQALLLSLESLPDKTHIVLNIEHPRLLLSTVVSRCKLHQLTTSRVQETMIDLQAITTLEEAIVAAQHYTERELSGELITYIISTVRPAMADSDKHIRAIRYLQQLYKDVTTTTVSAKFTAELALATWVRIKSSVKLPK